MIKKIEFFPQGKKNWTCKICYANVQKIKKTPLGCGLTKSIDMIGVVLTWRPRFKNLHIGYECKYDLANLRSILTKKIKKRKLVTWPWVQICASI